jgi:hypothetical protein
LFQDYPGNFCRKGRIEDHILVDKLFVVFVNLVVPLKEKSISVGKIECILPGIGLAELFYFLNDEFGHGVCCQLLLLDLNFSEHVEELGGAL